MSSASMLLFGDTPNTMKELDGYLKRAKNGFKHIPMCCGTSVDITEKLYNKLVKKYPNDVYYPYYLRNGVSIKVGEKDRGRKCMMEVMADESKGTEDEWVFEHYYVYIGHGYLRCNPDGSEIDR